MVNEMSPTSRPPVSVSVQGTLHPGLNIEDVKSHMCVNIYLNCKSYVSIISGKAWNMTVIRIMGYITLKKVLISGQWFFSDGEHKMHFYIFFSSGIRLVGHKHSTQPKTYIYTWRSPVYLLPSYRYNNIAHYKNEKECTAGCEKSRWREDRERAEMAERLNWMRVRGGDLRWRDDKDWREEEGARRGEKMRWESWEREEREWRERKSDERETETVPICDLCEPLQVTGWNYNNNLFPSASRPITIVWQWGFHNKDRQRCNDY